MHRLIPATAMVALLAGGCSATGGTPDAASPVSEAAADAASATAELHTYVAEVWADNWFSLYVDGELVGEDSVPITTERSFNAETIEFQAPGSFTLALVAKDFKENDTGLEYIGTDRQQMGDGGLIVQITDTTSGEVVLVSDASWRGLVVHTAPLDTSCERDPDPQATCESTILAEPDGWVDPDFDDTSWVTATVHTEAEVSPKDGYDQVSWDPSAQLIWTADLETDNTILWRVTAG